MILWLKDILLFSCHPCSGRKNMSLFSSHIIFPKMGKALAIEERTKLFAGDLGILILFLMKEFGYKQLIG